MQITADIARVNKDITEFHIIDGKWMPIFQIKRQNLLKLTIKKLVKDKIIYKNKDTYYIFGVKFNTYDEIYRKIIYYKTTPSSESIINRNMVIFNNKNIELMIKFNNYKTYQDQLNGKLKKAKELKEKYEEEESEESEEESEEESDEESDEESEQEFYDLEDWSDLEESKKEIKEQIKDKYLDELARGFINPSGIRDGFIKLELKISSLKQTNQDILKKLEEQIQLNSKLCERIFEMKEEKFKENN